MNLSPTSVASCTVSNQPYGQISVKPTVDIAGVAPAPHIDASLQFAGTYSCTPPATGPFAKTNTVAGNWGPVKANTAWASDPTKDLIPAGASCTITQTTITSQSTPQGSAHPAKPVANSGVYHWKPLEYASGNTITANAVAIGESLNLVTTVNKVERASNTTLRWTKVDDKKNLLTGAVFALKTTGINNVVQTVNGINDCVADNAAQCTGVDKDPQAGKYKVENVQVGSWELTETAAPAGFTKLAQPITGTIASADLANGKDAGEVVNQRITAGFLPALPITGGLSTTIFIFIGTAGLIAAAAMGILSMKRRERGRTTH
ncbi:prealbumin-like fold domain-containing protein [Arcanobacterium hippocoleae]|uniref:prealbumin-like fold domain-containing protein n=1 Tax=Arcanobacterium hippocoleae TaxID=149017 RepID=UPI00333EFDBB